MKMHVASLQELAVEEPGGPLQGKGGGRGRFLARVPTCGVWAGDFQINGYKVKSCQGVAGLLKTG
jgi:hypothetical protein